MHLDLGRLPGAGARPAQGSAPEQCPPESEQGERVFVQAPVPSLGEKYHLSKNKYSLSKRLIIRLPRRPAGAWGMGLILECHQASSAVP